MGWMDGFLDGWSNNTSGPPIACIFCCFWRLSGSLAARACCVGAKKAPLVPTLLLVLLLLPRFAPLRLGASVPFGFFHFRHARKEQWCFRPPASPPASPPARPPRFLVAWRSRVSSQPASHTHSSWLPACLPASFGCLAVRRGWPGLLPLASCALTTPHHTTAGLT